MVDEQVSPHHSQFLAAFDHPIRPRNEELTDSPRVVAG